MSIASRGWCATSQTKRLAFRSAGLPHRLFDTKYLICLGEPQFLHTPPRPANLDRIHFLGGAQAEMQPHVALGQVAAAGMHLGHQSLTASRDSHARADRVVV